ncbi:hypothetical protein [Sphingomonas sp. CV7422]|uniref:hypothetical protein n=1 Tax=Sphingomonas sp. CV7422 TaxID=3018036 RepID=UPI0022FE1402|nr:hypothetical protein [Sphingomonas sp. CV7422]
MDFVKLCLAASALLGPMNEPAPKVGQPLVTTEEAARPDATIEPRRSLFPGPAIRLLSPTPQDLSRPLTSPLHFKVAFVPSNSATIAPSAVAVHLMKQPSVDLTSRLGKSITSGGIDLPVMTLPAGRFPLLISVTDSNGDSRLAVYTLTVAK